MVRPRRGRHGDVADLSRQLTRVGCPERLDWRPIRLLEKMTASRGVFEGPRKR
jgi:hypothetical protein